MVLGYYFLNHDLAGPFKVDEKALHITSFEYPWILINFYTSPSDPLDPSFPLILLAEMVVRIGMRPGL